MLKEMLTDAANSESGRTGPPVGSTPGGALGLGVAGPVHPAVSGTGIVGKSTQPTRGAMHSVSWRSWHLITLIIIITLCYAHFHVHFGIKLNALIATY